MMIMLSTVHGSFMHHDSQERGTCTQEQLPGFERQGSDPFFWFLVTMVWCSGVKVFSGPTRNPFLLHRTLIRLGPTSWPVLNPTHGSTTRPTSAHIIPTLRRAHQNRRKSPPHSGFTTAATTARAAVQRQIPSSPRTLRKCHIFAHRVHPRSPTRNRKRTAPPNRNQHAPRRRARHLRTTIAAVPISVNADPSCDSPTINDDDNNAYTNTRPRPTIPSRVTPSPSPSTALASAARIRTSGAYERALVVRRSATRSRSRTRPRPFARTWIPGEPRTTTTISSTRAEFHRREGG